MKTLQHTLKLVLIAVVVLCASCSKNDDFEAPEPQEVVEVTTLDLLISGPWNTESIQYPGSPVLSDCDRQTTLNFIDEDTLLQDRHYLDAVDSCVSNGIESLSYTLSASDQLLISFGGPFQTYQIEFISTTQLIFTGDIAGDIVTFNMVKI